MASPKLDGLAPGRANYIQGRKKQSSRSGDCSYPSMGHRRFRVERFIGSGLKGSGFRGSEVRGSEVQGFWVQGFGASTPQAGLEGSGFWVLGLKVQGCEVQRFWVRG